jgi:hypothetical protein
MNVSLVSGSISLLAVSLAISILLLGGAIVSFLAEWINPLAVAVPIDFIASKMAPLIHRTRTFQKSRPLMWLGTLIA